MRNRMMRAVSRFFPTQLMGERPWLAALWRVLFYAIGPTEPFRFRTRDYEMFAVPQRWHLSRSVIRRGIWESYVTQLFRSYLRPGMTVVDVGANYGHYALTAANLIGPDGLAIAFEPHPSVCADLRRNASLVTHDNLLVFAIALGDTNGETEMAVDSKTSGRSSLVAELVPNPGETIRVPVRRLGDLLAEVAPSRRVGLMKVDVEGFEAQVFTGAWDILKRDLPVVFTEFSMARISRAGQNAGALLERLFALGYQAKLIDEKNLQLVPASLPVESWATLYGAHLNNVQTGNWFANIVLEANSGAR
jgi:FkbM family methyltransferase